MEMKNEQPHIDFVIAHYSIMVKYLKRNSILINIQLYSKVFIWSQQVYRSHLKREI